MSSKQSPPSAFISGDDRMPLDAVRKPADALSMDSAVQRLIARRNEIGGEAEEKPLEEKAPDKPGEDKVSEEKLADEKVADKEDKPVDDKAEEELPHSADDQRIAAGLSASVAM